LLNRAPEPQAGALVLFHPLPLGYSLAYLPKGPVGETWAQLWPEIDALCQQNRAVFLKVEPDTWERAGQAGHPGKASPISPPAGFRLSPQTIQPPRTLIVDLRGDEEQVLGRMKQKTRYNIRLAQKREVVIQASADLETFHRLMSITGDRDRFGVHSLAYYRRAYEIFHPRGDCELLLAEFQGEALAGLMIFTHGSRAWYLYGGSGSGHRDRMPNYLIQWEAMRWARARGCTEYDLWGVPDEEEEALEAQFTSRADGLWGVYRFKRGYGGELRRAAGPWDRVYQPVLYTFYLWWAKRRGLAG
jgi:lipid II:glycine glycyltransferase (peptidoglycan interpeptide bridge formation enzyme)